MTNPRSARPSLRLASPSRPGLPALAAALSLAFAFASACGGDATPPPDDAPDTIPVADTVVAPDVEGDTAPLDDSAAPDSDLGADTSQPPLTTAPLAPSHTAEQVADLEVLGPVIVDGGTSFTVYSAHATRLELVLFEDPDVATPRARVPMIRFGDVWSAWVADVGEGQHYGYAAWGPNWPWDPAWTLGSDVGFISDVDDQGNRFNPNKLLIDPYAKAVHRDHNWQQGIPATGHGRRRATWAAAAKSVVIVSRYTWSANEATWRARRADPDAPGNGWHEQVVYEVHPRGFTRLPSSGVDHPGTFRGVAEMADYLVDLGVTAVELMPIHEKPLDGGYWGYQPLNYFYPENSYAAATAPVGVVDEFKEMVDVLHQKGLEVWIDVVYNHTGEGGLWTERPAGFAAEDTVSLYSFRGLDNASYYALTADGRGYWPNTGVGNQTRTNHRPFQQLILDSLRYYAVEMGVDGFRFDLAPVLGARDGDYDRWDDTADNVLDLIINDPVLQAHNTRIVAEPWAVGGDYAFRLGGFPAAADADGVGWYEWNAHFRDWWRGFVNFDDRTLSSKEGPADGGFALTGSFGLFDHNGRRPYHSMNFITVHDGMTLYDLFSYDEKQNDCSPVVPICCNEPSSVWCQPDDGDDHNRSRDWGEDNEPFKRQLMRNMYAALMISHGTPLIYAGDEWLRTQYGNNNAWTDSADTAASWLQWGLWRQDDERIRMHDFVRQIIKMRHSRRDLFAPRQYGEVSFLWRNAANTGEPDWSSRHLAWLFTDPQTTAPRLIVLINLERHDVAFTLPAGRSWGRLVDTQRWFDDAPYFTQSGGPTDRSANIDLDKSVVVTGEYVVKDSSVVILEVVEP